MYREGVNKSRQQLERARQVLTSKAPNLTSNKAFPAFVDAPKGFLVATAGDGFGTATKLPSQANALKNAEAGQPRRFWKARLSSDYTVS